MRNRSEILNVVDDFYQSLYSGEESSNETKESQENEEETFIPSVLPEEVRTKSTK